MSTERNQFYAERDRRTQLYGVQNEPLDRPVSITVGMDAAECPTGQHLVLSTVNLAARLHRRIALDIPDVVLEVPSLVAASSLGEAAHSLARAINPFVELHHRIDRNSPALGIGAAEGTVAVGAHGFQAWIGNGPQPIIEHPAGAIGAGLAASIGTAALLQIVTGQQPPMRTVSLWEFTDGDGAWPGPSEPYAPIDVGDNNVVVGAGAVGSAVAYWLRALGTTGRWTFVDRDRVELHNTNRCIGLLAADAGWPDGTKTHVGRLKAEAAAQLLGGDFVDAWYDDRVASAERQDILLPLANERHVRQAVAALGIPLLVHGSTSANWSAELHRHGPKDDCTACRFPSAAAAAFACSSGPLAPTNEVDEPDAALPFLSNAAGLMVVAALAQLGCGYLSLRHNHHRLLFQSGIERSWQNTAHICNDRCRARPTAGTRRRLNDGSRWAHLDG